MDESFDPFVARAPHLLDKDLWARHWTRERLFGAFSRACLRRQTSGRSVFVKSLPVHRSGSPESLATA